ncbi:UNVERIFIED_ORG: hypothetical protein [Escherichia phage CMSTMSU]
MKLETEQPKLFVKGHVLITDVTDPSNQKSFWINQTQFTLKI